MNTDSLFGIYLVGAAIAVPIAAIWNSTGGRSAGSRSVNNFIFIFFWPMTLVFGVLSVLEEVNK